MAHVPHRRPATLLPRAAAPLLLLLALVPTAEAWTYFSHCEGDPTGLCEEVTGAVGLVVEVAQSPEGTGVVVTWGLLGEGSTMAAAICVRNGAVWVSQTGYCPGPAHSEETVYRTLAGLNLP